MTAETDIDAIVAGMTEAERAVLAVMSDGECAHPVAQSAADAGVPVADTRKAFRRFRDIGIADFGPLFDLDDGRPKGSGTWLNRTGLAVRARLGGGA